MKKYKVHAFVGVFEDKLEKIRKKLKKELGKPKEERHRAALRNVLKEAKGLRNMIRDMKSENGVEIECPHCKQKFEV